MLSSVRQSALVVSRYSQPACLTFVRFRKRRDVPMAKSKFFRVNEKPPEDPEERKELIQRRNHHSTEMRAITKLFKEQFIRRGVSSGSMSEVELQRYEDSDFQSMLHLNDKWNADVAREREIRTAKDMLDTEARTKGSIEKIGTKTLEDLLQKEEEVRLMKEKVRDFVTMENLEDKIDELLNYKVDYNFAIDIEGNLHKPQEELFALNQDEMNTKIEQSQLRVEKPTDRSFQ